MLTPETLFQIHFLIDAEFSPDGKRVVYVKTNGDTGGETTMGLWLYDLGIGEERKLTSGEGIETCPRWSPDGKWIAFWAIRGDFPRIYLLPVDGGESKPLTSKNQIVGNDFNWSPDSTQIVYTARRLSPPPDPRKPYRITRNIIRADGAGYLDQIVQDLFTISIADGVTQRLTDDNWKKSNPKWSPNGKKIAFVTGSDPDSFSLYSRLKVIDLTGETQDITGDWGGVSNFEWLPDNQRLVFVGGPADHSCSKNNLWVTNIQGDKPQWRSPGFKGCLAKHIQADGLVVLIKLMQPVIEISPDGEFAYVSSQVGGHLKVIKFSLSGPPFWEAVVEGDRSCILLDQKQSRLLYAVSSHNLPTDMFLADENGANEKRLTFFNKALLEKLPSFKVNTFTVEIKKGEPAEGWVMLPVVGEPPYPAVLYSHGGPHDAFGNIYSYDFQMLAAHGFAVIFMNPHGSTGYGDEFANSTRGDWGNLDYLELMAGVDLMIDQGIADPDRLGCCGLSYGGYMTCWIVGHTTRFKAAVAENPVTNLKSLFGTSDVGPETMLYEMKGLPHEVPEVYERCSPISYAHLCKTPTLLLQGEADYRCPAEQAEQFYTRLRYHGCVAEMVRFPGSSHIDGIAGSRATRKTQNEELLNWMLKYMPGA